ncbi:MAG: hypothetical protein LBU42_02975 [Prevotellaceae bacterium]|jgi:hypothetical protein|nr:hypothetical protein [Prevotellaceae bacterium]
MSHTDWIPGRHDALYHLVIRIWNYIISPGTRNRMGLDPGGTIGKWFDDTFSPAFTNYSAIITQWLDVANRTPTVIATLAETEKTFLPLLRQLYSLLKGDPMVTNIDLDAMGLPKRPSGGNQPHPVPTSHILVAKIIAAGPGELTIDYRDENSETKGKPFGVHGAELVYTISDTPITDHDDLLNSRIDTRTPFHLTFPDPQRGKTLYFSLRWENTTGEKGPWNQIQNTVIP